MNSVITLIFVAVISYYDPAQCQIRPINCFNPDEWWKMSSWNDARDWYGKALACPMEFPIGSHWRLPAIRSDGGGFRSKDWVCLDRGGMIQTHLDSQGRVLVVLDLLSEHPVVSETIEVQYRGSIPQKLLRKLDWLRQRRRTEMNHL